MRVCTTRIRPFNVASPDCSEAFFAGRVTRCRGLVHAGSLGGLRRVLDERARAHPEPAPITLDLIGHATRGHRLLRLGRTPIDMLDRTVAAFFDDLGGSGLLDRLGVVSVRLLGCDTGVTPSGRRTLRMLSRALRRPVYGTVFPLLKSHCDVDGFDPRFEHLLVQG
jgi:hypothetical protein